VDHGVTAGSAIEATDDPIIDNSRAEDLTRETVEMFEVSEVMNQVRGLVSFGTVVAAEGVVEVFLVNFQPDLVSRLDMFSFLR
jgi:hypothetical protein